MAAIRSRFSKEKRRLQALDGDKQVYLHQTGKELTKTSNSPNTMLPEGFQTAIDGLIDICSEKKEQRVREGGRCVFRERYDVPGGGYIRRVLAQGHATSGDELPMRVVDARARQVWMHLACTHGTGTSTQSLRNGKIGPLAIRYCPGSRGRKWCSKCSVPAACEHCSAR